jgi:aminoglycoside phosphotransferase (APT) family kinase protein
VHNDYRFDNVILDADNPMRIIGVLDWEMATLGDPLMDLGNSLAYWIEAGDPAPVQLMRRQPSNAPGMLTRRQFVDYYAERAGIRLDNFDSTTATACSAWPASCSRSTTASTTARPRTNASPSSFT